MKSSELIGKFQYMLDERWGYIWGTAGVKWTQAKQDALNKTTDSSRANSRKYGAKWIGHMVADCSGAFTWAFKQFGQTMYHGSNTMFDKWCESKGAFKNGKRTDGKELKPGTALFTGDTKNKGHVGLYIGNGYVIEAKGAASGVVKSSSSLAKWTYWGELKGVEFDGQPAPEPVPEKGYAIVTGKKVALRQGPTTAAGIITRIDTGRTVKIEKPPADWEYVSFNGKKGWMMKQFLKEGGS